MADFQDLELILDGNLARSAAAPLSDFRALDTRNAGEAAAAAADDDHSGRGGAAAADEDEDEDGDGEDYAQAQLQAQTQAREPVFYVPRPLGVASLSLAMGSLLSPKNIIAPHLVKPSRASAQNPARAVGFVGSQSSSSSSSSSIAAVGKKVTTTVAVLTKTQEAAVIDTSARRALNPSPSPEALSSSSVGVSLAAASNSSVPSSAQINGRRKVGTTDNFTSPFPDFQMLRGEGFARPKGLAGLRRASIVWFRSDLRVHDNEALVNASNESVSVLPVYCFDPRDYGKSSSGFDKTGPYRAKFLLECVATLRENLRERGSELVVRVGRPEEVLVALAKSVGADALYAHQEVAHEEMNAEAKVSAALKEEGVETKFFWGSTLFHIDDLPFKLEEMPSNYGGFREKMQEVEVRPTLPAPEHLKGMPIRGSVKIGDIPSLQDLGLNPTSVKRPQDQRTTYGAGVLVGGEQEALQRLKSFSAEASDVSNNSNGGEPDKTSNSIYGANFSCKISPWLAMGCLSPRRMFEDLRHSAKRSVSASVGKSAVAGVHGDGLNWLVFELLWRDFFRFITKKFGDGKRQHDSTPATACTGSLATA